MNSQHCRLPEGLLSSFYEQDPIERQLDVHEHYLWSLNLGLQISAVQASKYLVGQVISYLPGLLDIVQNPAADEKGLP